MNFLRRRSSCSSQDEGREVRRQLFRRKSSCSSRDEAQEVRGQLLRRKSSYSSKNEAGREVQGELTRRRSVEDDGQKVHSQLILRRPSCPSPFTSSFSPQDEGREVRRQLFRRKSSCSSRDKAQEVRGQLLRRKSSYSSKDEGRGRGVQGQLNRRRSLEDDGRKVRAQLIPRRSSCPSLAHNDGSSDTVRTGLSDGVSVFRLSCKACANSPMYIGSTGENDTMRHAVRGLCHQLWKDIRSTRNGSAAISTAPGEFGSSLLARHIIIHHCMSCESEREVFAWWKENVGVMVQTVRNAPCRTDGTFHFVDKGKQRLSESGVEEFPFEVSFSGTAEERIAIARLNRFVMRKDWGSVESEGKTQ